MIMESRRTRRDIPLILVTIGILLMLCVVLYYGVKAYMERKYGTLEKEEKQTEEEGASKVDRELEPGEEAEEAQGKKAHAQVGLGADRRA